jgi:hypothetical protein
MATFTEPLPPAVRVIEDAGLYAKVSTPPPGPVNGAVSATGPAKPLVARGLPRLVLVNCTCFEPLGANVTLVELEVRVNPLTKTEMEPEE